MMIDPADATRSSEDRTSSPRWSTLAMLMVAYTVYNIDKSILSVLIEPIKHEFLLTDSALGLLTGVAMIVPFVIACIPIGMLADSTSRKWVLIALLIGWSISIGFGSLATTVALLFISRMGVGLFESGFNPISLSLLNDTFPKRVRATAMGVFALGAPVGMFLAMALGGFVAQYYGWRTVFLIAAVPGFLVAAAIALWLKEPARDPAGQRNIDARRIPAVIAAVWRNKVLMHTGVGMAYCTVVVAGLAIWSPSFLVRMFGLGAHQAGLYAAIVVGASGALGAAGAGWLADRIGQAADEHRLTVVNTGMCCCVICGALAFLFAGTLPAVLVLLGLTAFFGQSYIGICNGIIATFAPDQDRAGTLAVLTIGFNLLAFGLGPSLVGMISDAMAGFAGQRSLGWGLTTTLLFSLVGVIHFSRARAALVHGARGVPTFQ